MDLRLRCALPTPLDPPPHPLKHPPLFAISTQTPSILLAHSTHLTLYNIPTTTHTTIHILPSPAHHLHYIPSSRCYILFLRGGLICTYVENGGDVEMRDQGSVAGDERDVGMVCVGRGGVGFVKMGSGSVWWLDVGSGGVIGVGRKFGGRGGGGGGSGVLGGVGGGKKWVVGGICWGGKWGLVGLGVKGEVRVWRVADGMVVGEGEVGLFLGERVCCCEVGVEEGLVYVGSSKGRVLGVRLPASLGGGSRKVVFCREKEKVGGVIRGLMFMKEVSKGVIVFARKRSLFTEGLPGFVLPVPERDECGRDGEMGELKVVACEKYGVFAAVLDDTGNVYIYEKKDRCSMFLSTGVDVTLSFPASSPISRIFANTFLFTMNGSLYSYAILENRITRVCEDLPSRFVKRITALPSAQGEPIAALIFFSDLSVMSEEDDREGTSRYCLATRGEGKEERWALSEDREGEAGCFYGDGRIVIVQKGISKKRGSVGEEFSFGKDGGAARGVTRFGFGQRKIAGVFRTPWVAGAIVIYHDREGAELLCSKGSSSLEIDDRIPSLKLKKDENVLDIRFGGGLRGEMGIVLTGERALVIGEDLQTVIDWEYRSQHVGRFVNPSALWMIGGGAFLVVDGGGEMVYGVTINGRAEPVTGLSRTENCGFLAAALYDRIIYLRPDANEERGFAVVTKPLKPFSLILRGLAALPNPKPNRSRSRRDASSSALTMESLKLILAQSDTSYSSAVLIDALVESGFYAVAYAFTKSPQSETSLAPLERSAILIRLGDLRGALQVLETTYAKESEHFSDLHPQMALSRALQSLVISACQTGDFVVAQRCSQLLGKKGTLRAFVSQPGGFTAAKALHRYARASGGSPKAVELAALVLTEAEKSVIARMEAEGAGVAQKWNKKQVEGLVFGEKDGIPQAVIKRGEGKEENWVPVPLEMVEIKDILQEMEVRTANTVVDFGGEQTDFMQA